MQTPQIKIKTQSSFSPTVLYLWFGDQVPQDYLISLSSQKYPLNFLKNPTIQRNFTRTLLEVQKSDYYRLQHLYKYGGIYSDFDNRIDYDCLIQILEPLANMNQDKIYVMPDVMHNRQLTGDIMNNFIYAPRPEMPLMKKILNSVDQTKQKIYNFAGLKFLGQFGEIEEIDVKNCIRHEKDWSWFQDANKINKKHTEAHQKYAKKKTKKAEILKQNQDLQDKVKTYQEKLHILQVQFQIKSKAAKFSLKQPKKSIEALLRQKLSLQNQLKKQRLLNFQLGQKNNKFQLLYKHDRQRQRQRLRSSTNEPSKIDNIITFGIPILIFVFIIMLLLILKKVRTLKRKIDRFEGKMVIKNSPQLILQEQDIS